MLKALLSILICLALSGCATTSSQYGYSGKALNEEYLRKFDDEQMLVLFDRVYKEPAKNKPDKMAKDITLTAFSVALNSRSRGSDAIKRSSVLDKTYNRIELNKWTDNDLVDVYNSISRERDRIKADAKKIDAKNARELTDRAGKTYWSLKEAPETENDKKSSLGDEDKTTLEIIHLTALFAINNELSRRDNVKEAWETVGSTAMKGVSIAAQVAMLLAKFLI